MNRAEGGGSFIDYRDIEGIDFLPPVDSGSDKLQAISLALHLINGQTVEIPVRGGRGKFRDVFEFSRFLKHAGEVRRNESASSRPGIAQD